MKSTLVALRILDQIAVKQPIGVSDLARELGVPKSNAQRAVIALRDAGWLTQDHSSKGRWVLTTKPLRLAALFNWHDALVSSSAPLLDELSRATQETIYLVSVEQDHGVLIDRREGQLPVRTEMPLGQRYPLHAIGAGKAILAYLPQAERDRVLGHGLKRVTARTVTNRAQLEQELAQIRDTGFATAIDELREGVSAVAAPIMIDGYPRAAVAIAPPTYRFDGEVRQRYGRLVLEHTRRHAELFT